MFTVCVYSLDAPLSILECFVYCMSRDVEHSARQAVYAASSICAIAILCQRGWTRHQV